MSPWMNCGIAFKKEWAFSHGRQDSVCRFCVLDLLASPRLGLSMEIWARAQKCTRKLSWTFLKSVLPRDIMALYFMTLKWVTGNGRTLPQVPESWEEKCKFGACGFWLSNLAQTS